MKGLELAEFIVTLEWGAMPIAALASKTKYGISGYDLWGAITLLSLFALMIGEARLAKSRGGDITQAVIVRPWGTLIKGGLLAGIFAGAFLAMSVSQMTAEWLAQQHPAKAPAFHTLMFATDIGIVTAMTGALVWWIFKTIGWRMIE